MKPHSIFNLTPEQIKAISEIPPEIKNKDFNRLTQEYLRIHNMTLDAFALAFIAETGYKANECILCQRFVNGILEMWFEKR